MNLFSHIATAERAWTKVCTVSQEAGLDKLPSDIRQEAYTSIRRDAMRLTPFFALIEAKRGTPIPL